MSVVIWTRGLGDDLWELRMTMEETMERTISLLDAAAVVDSGRRTTEG